MEFIPSIDLLGGQVVRLRRGDYAQVTRYSADPVATAAAFAASGVRRVHVVDLDGARDGHAGHREVVAQIVKTTGMQVQLGGGIRDAAVADHWLDLGVDRVVLGTAAVHNPEMVAALCTRHPGRVVVALDARGAQVVVQGWTEAAGTELPQLAAVVDTWQPAAVLYTAVHRDGMQSGPDVAGTVALQGQLRCDVIASGGIGTLAHVRQLAQARVRATVCGRALYEHAFSLEEALSASQSELAC